MARVIVVRKFSDFEGVGDVIELSSKSLEADLLASGHVVLENEAEDASQEEVVVEKAEVEETAPEETPVATEEVSVAETPVEEEPVTVETAIEGE